VANKEQEAEIGLPAVHDGVRECAVMGFPTRADYVVLAVTGEGEIRWAAGNANALLRIDANAASGKTLTELLDATTVDRILETRGRNQGRWTAIATDGNGAAASLDALVLNGAGAPAQWLLLLRRRERRETKSLDEVSPAVFLLQPEQDEGDSRPGYLVLWASPTAAALLHTTHQEIVGKPLHDALPFFEETWLEQVQRAERGEEPPPTVIPSMQPGRRFFHVAASKGPHNTVLCLIADVTAQVNREQEMRDMATRLEHVLEAAPIVLRVLGYHAARGDFIPEWVSPSVEQVLGYSVDEAMQPDWGINVINPADRDWVVARRKEIFKKGQIQLEYRVRTKWGRDVWVQDFARVTSQRDGQPQEVLATWSDITRRVMDEELVREQLRTVETLRSLGLEISQQRLPEELAQMAARKCVEVADATVAWVGLQQADGTIRPLGCWPPENTLVGEIARQWHEAQFAEGPTRRAVAGGEDRCYDDFAYEPAMAPWRAALERHGLRSGYAVPLISHGSTIGNLTVYSDQPGFFCGWRGQLVHDLAPMVAAELSARQSCLVARRALTHLSTLRRIDLQIIENPQVELVLPQLLSEVSQALGVDAVCFTSWDGTGMATVLAREGFTESPPHEFQPNPGSICEQILMSRSRMVVSPLVPGATDSELTDFARRRGMTWFCGQPLVARNRLLGILELYARVPLAPDEGWFELLDTLSGHGAVGLELAAHVERLHSVTKELRSAYEATLQGWIRALEMRDKETEGHTQRVTAMTLRLARASGVPEDFLPDIERGALLHDLGKIGIPDAILQKPGPLTEEEWAVMRQHPTLAREMLWPNEFLRPAIDIPYCHHEHWDGTGYPQGLKERAIPWPARLFAVVDVWDALTSDRPYRRAWPRDEALAYIRTQAGHHFDPRAVELFFEILVGEL
jgi:PAS domain S-box-containing protein